MATVSMTITGEGLQEILKRSSNKSSTDTWKLHSYSNAVSWATSTVLGDLTESSNYTAQDVDPTNLSTSFTDPTATLSYSGNITLSFTGASGHEGYYLTNQAGSILIAGGASTSRTMANGETLTVSSFAATLANA